MRKRSKYKPKPVLANPVAYVLSGVKKVAADPNDDDFVIMKTRYQAAFTCLATGKATKQELTDLCHVSNMAQALKRLDHKLGKDWEAEMLAGADALEAVINRKKEIGHYVCKGDELKAIRLLLDIHDAQLEDANLRQLSKGIALVKSKTKGLTPMEV